MPSPASAVVVAMVVVLVVAVMVFELSSSIAAVVSAMLLSCDEVLLERFGSRLDSLDGSLFAFYAALPYLFSWMAGAVFVAACFFFCLF